MKRNLTILLAALVTLTISGQLYIHETPYFNTTYDVSLQLPVRVLWTLHRSDIGQNSREPSWRFASDLPDYIMAARHSDYRHTGFDRGHLCPAKDRSFKKDALRATFVMSNVAPQTPALNRGAWKASEDSCRRLAVLYDSITVIACPVFLPADTARIGTARIGVPHAFFKACWVAGSDSVVSCWFMFNR